MKFRIFKSGFNQERHWIMISKFEKGEFYTSVLTSRKPITSNNEIELPEIMLKEINWKSHSEIHKPIINVFTRIKNGRQLVIFKIENFEHPIYLTSKQVKENTNLDINEVEMLTDSHLKTIFYKIGEEVLDGRICEKENLLVKDFWITLPNANSNDFRLRNKHKLIEFEIINDIHIFNKNSVINVGIKTDSENVYYVTGNRLSALTGLSKEDFYLLKTSFIHPEFYKDGEIMQNGNVCYGDRKLIKDLNLRFSILSETSFKFFKDFNGQ